MKTILKKYIFISIGLVILASCEKEEVSPAENNSNSSTLTKNSSTSSGQGGSLAQFAIVNDNLYTLDYHSIKVFDLSNTENPTLIKSVNLGVGIETIHAQNDYLFIGTNSGVRILDISNPTELEEISEFDHVTSCDPVIANTNIAISTLRGGTECGGDDNEFDIIDISNIREPELIEAIELENPYGLSFSNSNPNIVYICDGNAGLKAFDISDLENVELVMETSLSKAKDIIVTPNNTIIVLSDDGIYQYDASNPISLIEKSFISIN